MLREEWDKLTQEEKDKLTARWGLNRSGLNNDLTNDAELEKIKENVGLTPPTPLKIEDEKPAKKTRKLGNKKTLKLGNRRGTTVRNRRK